MNYKADSGYLAIGKQTDANTAVIPSVFVPMLEEDLSSDPNNERVKQIVGINWASNLVLQGNRKHGGKIKIMADPDTLGHFLNMVMKKGTTTGDASNGYSHPFTIDTAAYYTIEILKGNAVHRYVGCQINTLNFGFENGHLTVEAEIVAKSKFNYGTLKTALTGTGMLEVEFAENYDPEPCYGLVATDVIQVWNNGVATDVTVASVASDKKSITCASTSVTASVGALITLKGQTPSYSELKRPFRFGQMLVGLGADTTAADANAASYALATKVDDLKLEINRAIESRYASGDNDPILLEGVPDATLNLKKLFEKADDVQQWNDVVKKACTIIMTGDLIAGSVYSTLTIKLHNIKPKKSENKTKVGEYIYDETEHYVEYDNTDGVAVEISLLNSTATY
jgi:hypothetical protein